MDLSPSLPGLLNTIRLMAAGIAGYMAIQTAIFMFYGQRRRMYAYFLGMCIIATTTLMEEARLGTVKTVADAAYLLQWQFAFVLAFMPMLYGFVAAYVEQSRYQIWQWLLMALAAGLIVVNFTITPFSLRYSTLEVMPNYELPWGEVLNWYFGVHSNWYFFVEGLTTALLVWAIVRAKMLFYSSRNRSALFLIGALAFLLLTSSLGLIGSLVYVEFIFLGGLGVFGLLLFMSAALALEMRDNNIALKSTAENLHKEVVLHQQAEERIRHMAYHDYVTDLPNRIKLQELLAEALMQQANTGEKGALILLNLDDFKAFNDVLGHGFGDHLLQLVAARLLDLGQKGATLAHLGGDEFAMLLPDIGDAAEEAEAVARRVAATSVTALSSPFFLEGRSIELTASAGIALFTEEDENSTGLLQRADMALRSAKLAGRGSVQLYAAGMRDALYERVQLERDMRKGLERGEFIVYFQPQADLAGNIVGAEALLRWKHPKRGFVSPAVFVPIAESCGLISRMGDLVLQQACDQINSWEQSLPFFTGHISVNVSAWQFLQQNYKDHVRRHLAMSGINAARLTLEITESAFLHDIDEAISTINFLRSCGLRFSIDDFGTGYASLSYLRRLPVDELKIDQAFIRNLGADLRDTHLVETIVNIGKCMGMQVVAEGVENESQRSALKAMDCWAVQGYQLAPPMDKGAFTEWLVGRYQGNAVVTED